MPANDHHHRTAEGRRGKDHARRASGARLGRGGSARRRHRYRSAGESLVLVPLAARAAQGCRARHRGRGHHRLARRGRGRAPGAQPRRRADRQPAARRDRSANRRARREPGARAGAALADGSVGDAGDARARAQRARAGAARAEPRAVARQPHRGDAGGVPGAGRADREDPDRQPRGARRGARRRARHPRKRAAETAAPRRSRRSPRKFWDMPVRRCASPDARAHPPLRISATTFCSVPASGTPGRR